MDKANNYSTLPQFDDTQPQFDNMTVCGWVQYASTEPNSCIIGLQFYIT
jgi:hypothetical protein